VICPNCHYRDDEPTHYWTKRFKKELLSLNRIGTNVKGWRGKGYRNERAYYERRFIEWGTSVPPAHTHRQVIITRLYRQRCRPFDYDNLVGGAKALVDALKRTGLLLDDNDSSVSVVYRQEPSGGPTDFVQVQIQEYCDDRQQQDPPAES